MSLNKFEVLASKVMNMGIPSRGKERKGRKMILRKERLKEEKKKRQVEVRKIKGGKLLREVIVKTGLKQEDNEERIIVKALLDSIVTGLVTSSEFSRKKKFRKKKLNRPIYVRNIDGTFNHERPIKYTVEVELFYKEHKKNEDRCDRRTEVECDIGNVMASLP